MTGFIQDLVSFAGGEPLVPQVDRQAGQFSQRGGKGMGFRGLRAQVTGQMHRIANHDAHDGKAPRKTRQCAKVIPLIVPPFQGQHRLRRQPQFVRDGNADATVADIEAQIARMGNSFQLLAPDL